jgi:hypothetical protein
MTTNEKRIRALVALLATITTGVMIFALGLVQQRICTQDGCIDYNVHDFLWHPALFLAPVAAGLLTSLTITREKATMLEIVLVGGVLVLAGVFLGSHGLSSINGDSVAATPADVIEAVQIYSAATGLALWLILLVRHLSARITSQG